MFQWGLGLFLSFITFQSFAALPADCNAHVERIYKTRLENLDSEGVVTKLADGSYQPTMTVEQLYSSPRFRNFPAISYELLRWCPTLSGVDQAIAFLKIVGFDADNTDYYFKKLLFRGENPDLVIRQDQVGEHFDREKFADWRKQNALHQNLASHYALAVYKDANGDIKERAGANYIGNFEGLAIYTLPSHALSLSKDKISCENFDFIFPKAAQAPVKGQQTILDVPSMDIVFCALQLDERHATLAPAALNRQTLAKNTPLLTLGVGTDAQSKKLSLTVDASSECQVLVNPDQGMLYQSGVIDDTYRWAMGCDVSAGNSGDGVYRRETGALSAFVTSRSVYTYQSLAPQIFDGSMPLDRLYLETSQFVPLDQIDLAIRQLPMASLSDLQKKWIDWFLNL